jgi:hypothetical protein
MADVEWVGRAKLRFDLGDAAYRAAREGVSETEINSVVQESLDEAEAVAKMDVERAGEDVYYTVHPFADEWTWEPDTGGREPWVTTSIVEAVKHAIQVKREYIEVTPEADWQDTFWSLVYASDRRPRMGGPWEGVAVGWVDPWGEYHQGDRPPLDTSGSYLAEEPCS